METIRPDSASLWSTDSGIQLENNKILDNRNTNRNTIIISEIFEKDITDNQLNIIIENVDIKKNDNDINLSEINVDNVDIDQIPEDRESLYNGIPSNRRPWNFNSSNSYLELDDGSSYRSEDDISLQDIYPNTRNDNQENDNNNNNNNGNSSYFRVLNNRKKYNKLYIGLCLGFTLIALIAIVIGVVVHNAFKNSAKEWKGALGSNPGRPDSVALPVLNIVSSKFVFNATIYFGFSLDWMKYDPEGINAEYNISSSIFTASFTIGDELKLKQKINSTGNIRTVEDYFEYTAGLIGSTNAIMYINLYPELDMSSISESAMVDFVERCGKYNSWGISIMISLAPEMNGWWYSYGQQPGDYVQTFRTLSGLIRNNTNTYNMSALVWTPHFSPYRISSIGKKISELSSTANITDEVLLQLDSNEDGVLNELDDPFEAYYPGNDYVDWVGLTGLYSTNTFFSQLVNNNNSNFNNETVIEVNVNENEKYGCKNYLCQLLKTYNFYDRFSKDNNKPLILSDVSISNIKLHANFLKSMVEGVHEYPYIKGVTWYQYSKQLYEDNGRGYYIDSENNHVHKISSNITKLSLNEYYWGFNKNDLFYYNDASNSSGLYIDESTSYLENAIVSQPLTTRKLNKRNSNSNIQQDKLVYSSIVNITNVSSLFENDVNFNSESNNKIEPKFKFISIFKRVKPLWAGSLPGNIVTNRTSGIYLYSW